MEGGREGGREGRRGGGEGWRAARAQHQHPTQSRARTHTASARALYAYTHAHAHTRNRAYTHARAQKTIPPTPLSTYRPRLLLRGYIVIVRCEEGDEVGTNIMTQTMKTRTTRRRRKRDARLMGEEGTRSKGHAAEMAASADEASAPHSSTAACTLRHPSPSNVIIFQLHRQLSYASKICLHESATEKVLGYNLHHRLRARFD